MACPTKKISLDPQSEWQMAKGWGIPHMVMEMAGLPQFHLVSRNPMKKDEKSQSKELRNIFGEICQAFYIFESFPLSCCFWSLQDFEAWILQSGDLGVLQTQLDLLKRQQDEAALGAAAVSRFLTKSSGPSGWPGKKLMIFKWWGGRLVCGEIANKNMYINMFLRHAWLCCFVVIGISSVEKMLQILTWQPGFASGSVLAGGCSQWFTLKFSLSFIPTIRGNKLKTKSSN